MKLVNLGCGHRFHPAWSNFDFVPAAPGVAQADLRKGIPLADASSDVVYHSHVLEHFSRAGGASFLLECHRVLKPGGVLRIAVPDLEAIVRSYLASVDKLRDERTNDRERCHQWLIAEMIDQCARHSSGGVCAMLARAWPESDRGFLIDRWGGEAKRIFSAPEDAASTDAVLTLRHIIRRVRDMCLRFVTGVSRDAIDVGVFRLSGEPHLWMYDDFSLAATLEQVGFEHAQRMTARTSAVPDWETFGLDTDTDGAVYKPDSLFMEALKP